MNGNSRFGFLFTSVVLCAGCSATADPPKRAEPPTATAWHELSLGAEHDIFSHSGGQVWLTTVVPTGSGWGLFWLRSEPAQEKLARLYYAHVGLGGAVTQAPTQVFSTNRIQWRSRYYNVAWHTDHFGLFTAEGGTLNYRTLTLAGGAGPAKKVGPSLLADTQWDTEADSDIATYPDGFAMAIEGECMGHSCAYVFRVDPNGAAIGSVRNFTDPYAHEFFPRLEYDGSGFTILSVKDIQIDAGGVATRYMTSAWQLKDRKKVVPSKQYMWDERTALAFNGQNYAALWSENPQRSHSQPWQIHFATFQRDATVASPIAAAVLSQEAYYPGFRWCSRVHAWGPDFLVHYLHGRKDQPPEVVFQVIANDGSVKSTLKPFAATADALSSSPHPSQPGQLGVLRADQTSGGFRIVFQVLSGGAAPPPQVSIGGRIRYHATQASLAGVRVVLADAASGATQAETLTDASGNYEFSGLSSGKSWRLTPYYAAPHPLAVSSLDASWVLQTVAGTRILTALERIAGDTTGDGTLSALDATRMLQYVAGLIGVLPAAALCKTSWLFAARASSGAVAPALAGSSCQTGARVLSNVAGNVADADFDAVLIGDVTGNFSP